MQVTLACMAALSSAALVLLMQSHKLAAQLICECDRTACVVITVSQSHVKCTAMHGVGC